MLLRHNNQEFEDTVTNSLGYSCAILNFVYKKEDVVYDGKYGLISIEYRV